jgi:hypothetical protein
MYKWLLCVFLIIWVHDIRVLYIDTPTPEGRKTVLECHVCVRSSLGKQLFSSQVLNRPESYRVCVWEPLMYRKAKELDQKKINGIRTVGTEDSQGNMIVDVLKIWEIYVVELYGRANRPENLNVEPKK